MSPVAPESKPVPEREPTADLSAVSPQVRQALLALQQSRLALRTEMLPPADSADRTGPAPALARRWWRRLRTWPVGRVAGPVLHHWWRRQPWYPVGDMLLCEVRGRLWPLMRRHPWASAGVAVAGMAAVLALRPWRWTGVEQRVRQAPAAASSWLLDQLSTAPVQAVIASLLAMAAKRWLEPAATAADGTAMSAVPADPVAAPEPG